MANRLQKLAVLTYVPAVSPVSYRPAACFTTNVVVGWKKREAPASGAVAGGGSGGRSSSTPVIIPPGYSGVSVPGGVTPVYQAVHDSSGYGSQLIGYTTPGGASSGAPSPSGGGGSGMVPIYSYETVCNPERQEVKGSPARIDSFAANGWNGGARSIDQVPAGGYFELTIPDDPLGVLVGFSDGAFDHSYGHSSHGLVARPGGITPVEYGVDVGPEVAGGRRIRMVRGPDTVRMYVDGNLVHVSANAVTGHAYVDATLYALSDFVDDPIIGDYLEGEGAAEMALGSSLAAHGGGTATLLIEAEGFGVLDGVSLIGGTAEMLLVSEALAHVLYQVEVGADFHISSHAEGFGLLGQPNGFARGMAYSSAEMAAVGFGSDRSVARASGIFSPPVLDARINRPEAEVTQAVGIFPIPLVSGHVLNGGVLSGAGSMTASGKGSEGVYLGGIAAAATSYRLIAWESYLPEGRMDGGDLVYSFDRFAMDTLVLFALTEGLSVSDTLDIYLIVSMEAYEAMAVSDAVTLHSVVHMAIRERMAICSKSSAVEREAIQYAVNAISGAVSRYENFGFRQFASAGGHTYAIDGSGLYRLESQSDHGAALNAVIDFGASDYGTAQAKRVGSVYAGIATDGCVYLRVTGDNGQERIYRAIGGENESRAMTAKGLAARHWRIRLELVDASYADLDNIEVEVGVSQRRLRR